MREIIGVLRNAPCRGLGGFVCILLALFSLPGCWASKTTNDVSQDRRYLLGYMPGQVYRLRVPTPVTRYPGGSDDCFLETQEYVQAKHPPDVRFVIVQVLPAGSRIRIDRLEHTRLAVRPIGFYESYVHVFVTSVDHPVDCGSLRLSPNVSGVIWLKEPNGESTSIGTPLPERMELEVDH